MVRQPVGGRELKLEGERFHFNKHEKQDYIHSTPMLHQQKNVRNLHAAELSQIKYHFHHDVMTKQCTTVKIISLK